MSGSTAESAAFPAAARIMVRRRVIFVALCLVTAAALLWAAGLALSPGGLGPFDYIFLLFFAVTLPWTVIGFWNAVIGFSILRLARDPLATVNPPAARIKGDEPVTGLTALLLCIRNEPPERVIRNLDSMLTDLATSGHADRFHVYVLSDTSDPGIAALERAHFAALVASWRSTIGITYRRRDINTGFKAGNIRDFCERWGCYHELALTLDADSFMTAQAMLRLVRIMQASPRLGILQSLVAGLPATSAFARLFQFGMRLGMRSYTAGATWWQGDCGPYWGHNAVFRVAPFYHFCHLPPLPENAMFGGQVLSHDQIEAVLMRRAGYEVRVMPVEDESWEENPPTLVEFLRRDLRWCQGNMQYWYFLGLPGLKAVSRYQLIFALLMFIGSPAWIGLLVLGTVAAAWSPDLSAVVDRDAGLAVFLVVFIMWFTPKYFTALDVLTRADARRSFGGTIRFLAGLLIETLFSILLVPVMWFGHAVFLAGLLLGRRIGWTGQTRDDHSISWRLALRNFWPETLLGGASLAALALTHPVVVPFAFFSAGGLALSIPLAVFTSSPELGRFLARIRLCTLPEETNEPAALRDLVRAGDKPNPAAQLA